MRTFIAFVSTGSIVSLLAAGCGFYLDLEPDDRPDASPAVDATPPADAAVTPPDAGAVDTSPISVGTCVPRDAIAPPATGECLAPELAGYYMYSSIDDWYSERRIAEASCTVQDVSPLNGWRFELEMNCLHTAGDPFDSSEPIRVTLSSAVHVLPPQLVAGERFALRIANYSPDGDGSEENWLTMRSEVDGALWLALVGADTLVPEQELLDRISLTADEWLAPFVVETATSACPSEPDAYEEGGTVQRVAVDVTAPGGTPLRLVDRRAAYLDDAYLLEVGAFTAYTRPQSPDAWPRAELLIAAIDLCAE